MLAAVPSWYRPLGHLFTTVGVGLVVLVLSNYFEWRVHKKLLHQRWFRPLSVLYDRHTPEHHVVFVESDMAIRSMTEFRLVLLPAIGIVGIVVATAPFAVLFATLFGGNVGWLFLSTAAMALVSYEVLHLTYHLSPKSWIGGSRLISFLRRHHARHHNPRYMQKWNFNVTLPLFDWVFRTTHRGEPE